MTPRRLALPLCLCATLLVACATPARSLWLPETPALLLGEQHDAAEHQAMARQAVEQLAREGRLAAVVLEMAERGHQTDGLPRDADEATVRARLNWHERWPWPAYGPVAMAAVRAGVPVRGGNLPRADMGAATQDETLERLLAPEALARQHDNVRLGHCDLLPAALLPGMVRIQVARDRAMAQTLTESLRAGQTVLLLAGAEHVKRGLGIPAHLAPELAATARVVWMQAGERPAGAPDDAARADAVWASPPVPAQDHCTELKKRLGR